MTTVIDFPQTPLVDEFARQRDAQGFEAAVRLWLEHPDDDGLMCMGAVMMRSELGDGDRPEDLLKVLRLIEAGAMRAIVPSLKAHVSLGRDVGSARGLKMLEVGMHGMASVMNALWKATLAGRVGSSSGAFDQFVDAGGLPIVIEAMGRHPESDQLRSSCISALLGVCDTRQNRDLQAMHQLGLIPLLVEGLGRGAETATRFLDVLLRLCRQVHSGAQDAVDAGGIERCIRCLSSPQITALPTLAWASVVQTSTTCLALMCRGGRHARRIVDGGGITAVLQATKTHGDVPGIEVAIVTLLAVVTVDGTPHIAEQVGAQGGVKALCRIATMETRQFGGSLARHTLNRLKVRMPGEIGARDIDRRMAKIESVLIDGCSQCGRTASEAGVKVLKRCSACVWEPRYCSAACQKKAWKEHKSDCRANPKAPPAAAAAAGGEAGAAEAGPAPQRVFAPFRMDPFQTGDPFDDNEAIINGNKAANMRLSAKVAAAMQARGLTLADLHIESVICGRCGKGAGAGGAGGAVACTLCSLGRVYCSAECQKQDWANHKAACLSHPAAR